MVTKSRKVRRGVCSKHGGVNVSLSLWFVSMNSRVKYRPDDGDSKDL
jgi:hypothetical protein